ncbi:MAG: integrase arm-type DNA-binding domain-containing protein [Paracoccaceae bacterium]|nr:integrase arm-type DNA-binding domain-containing protein [Paracoccaceae bacterium]MDG2257789.1 integrase arm-type DNA-binding domain-containing protein [Paracoccaceae bacterium]
MTLSAAFVRTAKIPGRFYDGGATGLHLFVKPNGSKFFVQRLTIRGKKTDLGLGSPPITSLAHARDIAIENKRIARAGGDPLAEKRRKTAIPTFEIAARQVVEELGPTWRGEKEIASFTSTMERYVFPAIGNQKVSLVRSADVRDIIMAIRAKVPTVAARLQTRISAVFKYSIAKNWRADNPATGDALALPKPTHKPKPRVSLPYQQVAGCIEAVKSSRAWIGTKLAIEFTILTASRSGEVRKAKWDEIKGDLWKRPADHMKEGIAHAVPLSDRALSILNEAKSITNESGLIFPASRGKIMSDMTMSKLVKELGFDADVHGFRTSFRTWSQEQTNFAWEVGEVALAHRVGGKSERAYARSDYLEKRRLMMETWSSYLTLQRGAVVQING